MGTGLDLIHCSMDRKIPIPTALWKKQLLQLVNESPKAVCVECKCMTASSGSSRNSPTSDPEFSNNISLSSLILHNGDSGCQSPKAGSTLNGTSTASTTTIATSTSTTNNCWDQLDLSSCSRPFGKAFHGFISHSQTLELLQQDGQYLVRKQDDTEDFILSLRFNGYIKHFIVSCDDSTGFLYVGDRDKPYHSLQELVQEGLTTLYLDLKAGRYIELMCDLTHYHGGTNGMKYNSSRKNSSSPSPSSSTISRIERQRNPDLKTHSFIVHNFEGLSRCQICQNFMWFKSSKGNLKCKDCGFSIHESCADKIFNHECEPRVEFLKEIFGTDLTTVVKATGDSRPPFVIEKCIAEIESKGLHIEGIYRVSGSRELIERLKSYLEQERMNADMSHFIDNHSFIHSMCGLVKLYLRLLPVPLITTEVFQKFLTLNGPLTLEVIKTNIRKLPLAHQITLKYLLQHLYKVASKSEKNKMNPFNLSSVFAPSLLCPQLISLNTLKIGTNILETMIANYPELY